MTANELENLVVELAQRVERLEEILGPEAATIPELEAQHRKFVDQLRERKEG